MADPRSAADPPLQPRPWRLQEPPPLQPPAPAQPLLLLLDRRDPLPQLQRDGLLASLSPAERQRHLAYRRPGDRDRFLLARGGLRRLLAGWLGCAAARVPLEAGVHGKPHCPAGPAFNLSHSGDLIVFALHCRWAVGVDVEQLRPGLDWQPIARRVLPEPQQQILASLPAAVQGEGFLQCWCRLEAELKAYGAGFSALERLRAGSKAAPVRHWRLLLPVGYRGAVALIPA
jgi:4'-phosphopantetheinyl transferase